MGPKSEEIAGTRATLLEIGQYGRMDGSVKAPLLLYSVLIFNKKPWSKLFFSGASLMRENLS